MIRDSISLSAPQRVFSLTADRESRVFQVWASTLPPVPTTNSVMPLYWGTTTPELFSGCQRS